MRRSQCNMCCFCAHSFLVMSDDDDQYGDNDPLFFHVMQEGLPPVPMTSMETAVVDTREPDINADSDDDVPYGQRRLGPPATSVRNHAQGSGIDRAFVHWVDHGVTPRFPMPDYIPRNPTAAQLAAREQLQRSADEETARRDREEPEAVRDRIMRDRELHFPQPQPAGPVLNQYQQTAVDLPATQRAKYKNIVKDIKKLNERAAAKTAEALSARGAEFVARTAIRTHIAALVAQGAEPEELRGPTLQQLKDSQQTLQIAALRAERLAKTAILRVRQREEGYQQFLRTSRAEILGTNARLQAERWRRTPDIPPDLPTLTEVATALPAEDQARIKAFEEEAAGWMEDLALFQDSENVRLGKPSRNQTAVVEMVRDAAQARAFNLSRENLRVLEAQREQESPLYAQMMAEYRKKLRYRSQQMKRRKRARHRELWRAGEYARILNDYDLPIYVPRRFLNLVSPEARRHYGLEETSVHSVESEDEPMPAVEFDTTEEGEMGEIRRRAEAEVEKLEEKKRREAEEERRRQSGGPRSHEEELLAEVLDVDDPEAVGQIQTFIRDMTPDQRWMFDLLTLLRVPASLILAAMANKWWMKQLMDAWAVQQTEVSSLPSIRARLFSLATSGPLGAFLRSNGPGTGRVDWISPEELRLRYMQNPNRTPEMITELDEIELAALRAYKAEVLSDTRAFNAIAKRLRILGHQSGISYSDSVADTILQLPPIEANEERIGRPEEPEGPEESTAQTWGDYANDHERREARRAEHIERMKANDSFVALDAALDFESFLHLVDDDVSAIVDDEKANQAQAQLAALNEAVNQTGSHVAHTLAQLLPEPSTTQTSDDVQHRRTLARQFLTSAASDAMDLATHGPSYGPRTADQERQREEHIVFKGFIETMKRLEVEFRNQLGQRTHDPTYQRQAPRVSPPSSGDGSDSDTDDDANVPRGENAQNWRRPPQPVDDSPIRPVVKLSQSMLETAREERGAMWRCARRVNCGTMERVWDEVERRRVRLAMHVPQHIDSDHLIGDLVSIVQPAIGFSVAQEVPVRAEEVESASSSLHSIWRAVTVMNELLPICGAHNDEAGNELLRVLVNSQLIMHVQSVRTKIRKYSNRLVFAYPSENEIKAVLKLQSATRTHPQTQLRSTVWAIPVQIPLQRGGNEFETVNLGPVHFPNLDDEADLDRRQFMLGLHMCSPVFAMNNIVFASCCLRVALLAASHFSDTSHFVFHRAVMLRMVEIFQHVAPHGEEYSTLAFINQTFYNWFVGITAGMTRRRDFAKPDLPLLHAAVDGDRPTEEAVEAASESCEAVRRLVGIKRWTRGIRIIAWHMPDEYKPDAYRAYGVTTIYIPKTTIDLPPEASGVEVRAAMDRLQREARPCMTWDPASVPKNARNVHEYNLAFADATAPNLYDRERTCLNQRRLDYLWAQDAIIRPYTSQEEIERQQVAEMIGTTDVRHTPIFEPPERPSRLPPPRIALTSDSSGRTRESAGVVKRGRHDVPEEDVDDDEHGEEEGRRESTRREAGGVLWAANSYFGPPFDLALFLRTYPRCALYPFLTPQWHTDSPGFLHWRAAIHGPSPMNDVRRSLVDVATTMAANGTNAQVIDNVVRLAQQADAENMDKRIEEHRASMSALSEATTSRERAAVIEEESIKVAEFLKEIERWVPYTPQTKAQMVEPAQIATCSAALLVIITKMIRHFAAHDSYAMLIALNTAKRPGQPIGSVIDAQRTMSGWMRENLRKSDVDRSCRRLWNMIDAPSSLGDVEKKRVQKRGPRTEAAEEGDEGAVGATGITRTEADNVRVRQALINKVADVCVLLLGERRL